MAGYRKILVAYDGSASARNALMQASVLARQDKSWIKVLAVVPTYDGDLDLTVIGNIKETIIGPGRKHLEEAKRIADSEDVHILTDLEQGEPWDRIVHTADDENCDLIVLGRHGTSHIERALMGGVTARVIGHTAKDVLVVPSGCGLRWNHLLLATDGSPSSEAGVAKALKLAQHYKARITAVAVVDTTEEFQTIAPDAVHEMIDKAKALLETVADRGREMDLRIKTVVREGEPHLVIRSLAETTGADCIIMGSHGRKGLTRLLMGSVTEKVIGLGFRPVIVSHHAPS